MPDTHLDNWFSNMVKKQNEKLADPTETADDLHKLNNVEFMSWVRKNPFLKSGKLKDYVELRLSRIRLDKYAETRDIRDLKMR